ncbi:cyclin N-terminal domain-containing protein 1-like [Limulus polyphemus]|uniref:Cyclin N-terminal domain-containing protein 1-like n=1 Tax=Limulus polyphemus TaxID=6850 RepID=A0ABM1T1G8_LIMPO|nr:cyclin N-terminal domain-containing protein 1-like [Limulus polyphemus]
MACGTTGSISDLMEPVFNSELGTVSVDLLEDWLFLIALKNSENVVNPAKSKVKFQGNWTSGKVVESIFNVCEWSKEPIEVSFTAVELFDQFLIHHVQDLYMQVEKNKKSTSKPVIWQVVEDRIQKQMMLRVVSCVQLASKQHSHCRCIQAINIKSSVNVPNEYQSLMEANVIYLFFSSLYEQASCFAQTFSPLPEKQVLLSIPRLDKALLDLILLLPRASTASMHVSGLVFWSLSTWEGQV